jgi:small subunit ribosomal protein S5
MAPPNNRRGGGDRRGRGPSNDEPKSDIVEKVVFINRCAKVVKGGRRFSFSALIVAGDKKGKVGYGFGKANEVAEAIRKASESAKKKMVVISVRENTIPHEVTGEFGGGRVLLRPASPGTGVIAGGGVRAVIEAVGIRDVLAKSLGSSNHANVVKATIKALTGLRQRDAIMKIRGKAIRPAAPQPEATPVLAAQA